MTEKIKVKDVYCPLPFNHMNWHPNGNVSVCCVAEMFPPNDGFYRNPVNKRMMNLSSNSVHEIWNQSSVEEIRQQMLQGVEPPACKGCYKIEDRGGTSRRQNERKRWGQNLTTPKLEFIDLRMSNLCNSKCMMCYPDSSSSLIKEYSSWEKELDFVPKNATNYELFQWFDEETIEQLLEHKDTLKYLYINGGEPFMMPQQWKLLERLIDEGVSKNIHVSYNTNCSLYEDRFNEIWKDFKIVTLGMSVDAVADKNKWIRKPINTWESISKNIDSLVHAEGLDHINLTCTIQWINLPFMEEYYDWALPIIQQKEHSTINQNFVTFPNYLSVNCASKRFKQEIHEKFKKSRHAKHILTPTMVSYLEADEEDEVMWNNGMKFADTVSKQRDNWREVFDYEYRF